VALDFVKQAVGRPYRALTGWVATRFLEPGAFSTSGPAELEQFGVAEKGRIRYEPSGWFYLRRALRGTKITRDDVFLDYGSGKGRIVYQAARYPFRRVIGVEIAEDMNRMARANIDRVRDRLTCQDVELITADATEYELPDDVTYAYIYNSVEPDLLRRVLERIVASLDRAPRRLTLLWVSPKHADQTGENVIRETGRFGLVSKRKGLRRDIGMGRIGVWVSDPNPTA
jgi:Methyltransferase domain